MSKLSLTLYTFSITGLVASLFLILYILHTINIWADIIALEPFTMFYVIYNYRTLTYNIILFSNPKSKIEN